MRDGREGVIATLAITGDEGGTAGVIRECRRDPGLPVEIAFDGLDCVGGGSMDGTT
jgi:hypothetical protein